MTGIWERIRGRGRQPGLACSEVVELVTAYLEGGLAAEDHARFEAHLALCDGCTRYVEQMRTTIALTGRIDEDDLSDEAKDDLLAAFRGWSAR